MVKFFLCYRSEIEKETTRNNLPFQNREIKNEKMKQNQKKIEIRELFVARETFFSKMRSKMKMIIFLSEKMNELWKSIW